MLKVLACKGRYLKLFQGEGYSMINRLARSQARGIRQLELVNELLGGGVEVSKEQFYSLRFPSGGVALFYGDCKLPQSSFLPLKRRLVEVGFAFKRTGNKIEMRFTV